MNLPTIASANNTKPKAQFGKILLLAAPVGGIVASLIVAVFIVWPKVNEVMVLREANVELALKADALDAKIATLQSFDQAELEKQLSLSDKLLPSDKGMFTFLAQIETMRAQAGVLVNKVDVTAGSLDGSGVESGAVGAAAAANSSKSPTSSLSENVEVKLSLSSSYASLLQFLSTMYSASRVVAVDDVSLSSTSDTAGLIRSTLTVRAFWQPLPSDLGSVEDPVSELTSKEKELLDKVEVVAVAAPQIVVQPLTPGKADLFAPF